MGRPHMTLEEQSTYLDNLPPGIQRETPHPTELGPPPHVPEGHARRDEQLKTAATEADATTDNCRSAGRSMDNPAASSTETSTVGAGCCSIGSMVCWAGGLDTSSTAADFESLA